jgi:SMI1/KNR4 family protein SUKH-1
LEAKVSQPLSMSAVELVDAIRSLPPGRGFLAGPATKADVDALVGDLPAPLPRDVRELLLLSDGIGVAGMCGFYLPSVVGLRRLAADDTYGDAFPGALPVGDDGAQGLYLVDTTGSIGGASGVIILTDRGSLLATDSVAAGPNVSAVLQRVINGDDLWELPRLQPAR